MRCTLFAIAAMLALVSFVLADEHGDRAGIYPPDAMMWKEGPKSIPVGAELAVLEGDPGKEGPFVMRLRLPDGYEIPAHTHPKTERLTVISGTFNIVMGESLNKKNAQKMPAGSYGNWPAGLKHLVWAEGVTVVQLHGIGPWQITYVNAADDPRTK